MATISLQNNFMHGKEEKSDKWFQPALLDTVPLMNRRLPTNPFF